MAYYDQVMAKRGYHVSATDPIETGVMLVSAAAAGMAAWWAYKGVVAQRHTLALARAQDERHQPVLELYVRDAGIVQFKSSGHRVFAFCLRITNTSDAQNAVVEVNLELTAQRDDGPRVKLVVAHEPAVGESLPSRGSDSLRVPSSLGPRASVEAWVTFRVADELLVGSDVCGYEIEAHDAHAQCTRVRPIILRELSSDEWLAR